MIDDLVSKCSAIAASVSALPCISNSDSIAIGRAIDKIQPVDAVEVVRCRDCKYGIPHRFYISYKCTVDAEYDESLGGYVGFTKWQNACDFCSKGERREDG